MSERVQRRMTTAEFLEWELDQEWRHELVDGVPQAMTGARVEHDLVLGNLRAALQRRLREAGSPCAALGADIALIVPSGAVRRPDVAVYCPPFDRRATALEHPRLLVEVLSDSTRSTDLLQKLDEYRAIASLDHLLFVEPAACIVGLWSRDSSRVWQYVALTEMTDIMDLPLIQIRMQLAEIYEEVMFATSRLPRLVWPEPEEQ